MIDPEPQQRCIAETAYGFRILGYYGTESKAVTALQKRKGMEHFDRQSATEALNEELSLIDRTQILIQGVLKREKKRYHSQLTQEQFEAGTEFIRKELVGEFPKLAQSVDYMLAMLWHMPRVR